MKKVKLFSTLIATFAIIAISLPAYSNFNEVVAQTAETCTEFYSSFTEADYSYWFPAAGTYDFKDGALEIVALSSPDGYIGAVTLKDPTSVDNFVPMPFTGDHWIASFDIVNTTNYSSDVSSALSKVGATVFFSTGTSVDDFYTVYIGDTAEGGKEMIIEFSENGVEETYGPYNIPEYTNGATVSVVVKKLYHQIELGYKIGDMYPMYLASLNIDETSTAHLTVTSQFEPQGGSVSIDNFQVDCQSSVNPEIKNVARFFNVRVGSAHFYTIDNLEAEFIRENSAAGGMWPGAFVEEAPTFAAWTYPDSSQPCTDGTWYVKRYLNTNTGSTHFYTIDDEEMKAVEMNFPETFFSEGVAFCAYKDQVEGTIPVYRWQNTILGSTHFYTADQVEIEFVDGQLQEIFLNEGIAFYAYPVQ